MSPNSGWSTYQDQGGPAAGLRVIGAPTALNNADQRIEVFVTASDSNVYHNWQEKPSAAPWSGWMSLPKAAGKIGGPPSGGINKDGRLEVFAQQPTGVLAHIWQVAPNAGWSTWSSLGAPPPGMMAGTVAVASNQDGRLEVFVVGEDGALWHIWQTAPNNGWSTWASFSIPAAQTGLAAQPIVCANANGTLAVFVIDSNQNIWYLRQTSPNNGWSGWACLSGGGFDASFSPAVPAAGRNADGRLEVFALKSDRTIGHTWQTAANGLWRIANVKPDCAFI